MPIGPSGFPYDHQDICQAVAINTLDICSLHHTNVYGHQNLLGWCLTLFPTDAIYSAIGAFHYSGCFSL